MTTLDNTQMDTAVVQLDTIISVIAICISFISLAIAVYSLWRSRKVLHIKFDESLLKPECFYDSADDALSDTAIPFYIDKAVLATFTVINPSLHDIAYFHIEALAFNKQGRIIKDISFSSYPTEDGIIKDTCCYRNENSNAVMVELATSPYGVFGSQSYNRMQLLVKTAGVNDIEKLYVGFKTPLFSLRKRPTLIDKKRHYRSYGKMYDMKRDVIEIKEG